jgi:hypothetical protein
MWTPNQDTPDDQDEPATPSTPSLAPKLNVRPDLYDEQYSAEQYEQRRGQR